MGRAGKHRKAKEEKGIEAPKKGKKSAFEVGKDEDIDDDLAFDSEDEAKFGHFFAGKEELDEVNTYKGKKGKKAAAAAPKKSKGGKAQLSEFDELYDGGDDSDESDDVEEGFDISDLLDTADDKKRKKKSSAAKALPKAKHGSARAVVTRESETLFGDASNENRATAAVPLRSLVRETAQAAGKKSAKVAKRLEDSALNKKHIFATDEDPDVKATADRQLTREEVQDRSKKWQPVLQEIRKAKNVQFPLTGAEESAVPTTLGTIATMAEPQPSKKGARTSKRGRDDEEEEGTTANKKAGDPRAMAAEMNALLMKSGLSTKVANPSVQSREGKQIVASFTSKDTNFIGLGDKDAAEAEGDEAEPEPVNLDYVKKLKAMMSYEIAKRRRFNQIKSKTYRRILRKEKEREADKRQRALEILNPEAARRRQEEKMAKRRAEERATQKHKNTSKWVKHVKKFTKFDDDTRDAVDDQLKEHQRLMQRMEEDAANELQEAAEESESEEEERRVDELLADPTHTLQQKGLKSALWGNTSSANQPEEEEAFDPSDPSAKARHELKQMGFMKRAKERQENEMEEQWGELKEDIQRYHEGKQPLNTRPADEYLEGADADELQNVQKEDDRSLRLSLKGHSVLTRGQSAADRLKAAKEAELAEAKAREEREGKNATTGRKSFGGLNDTNAAAPGEERLKKPEVVAQLTSLKGTGMRSQGLDQGEEEEEEEENEEVAAGGDETDGEEGDEAPRPVAASATAAAKKASLKSNVLGGSSVIPAKKKGTKKQQSDDVTESSRVGRSVQIQEHTTELADPTAVGRGKAGAGFGGEEDNQEYLVARAFAADDVDEDFLKLKEQQVETIMKPQDANATLPGWGEWGGESEKLNQRHKEKVATEDLKRNIEKSSLLKARVDAKMSNVIINHEVDLVPTPYALKMVPRPFANATEYQRSMRQPKGPEWNTASTFRDGVKPRVSTKQGTIIDPLAKETGKRKPKKTTMRKRPRDDQGQEEAAI